MYNCNPYRKSIPQIVYENEKDIQTLFKKLPFNMVGDWDAKRVYKFNDLVRYNNASWVFKSKKCVVGIPPTDGEYWALLVHDGGTYRCDQLLNCANDISAAIYTKLTSETLDIGQENSVIKLEVKDNYVKKDLSNLGLAPTHETGEQSGEPFKLEKYGLQGEEAIRISHHITTPIKFVGEVTQDNNVPNLGQVKKLISAGGGNNKPEYLWKDGLKAMSPWDIETTFNTTQEFNDKIYELMGSRGMLQGHVWWRSKADSNVVYFGRATAYQNQFRTVAYADLIAKGYPYMEMELTEVKIYSYDWELLADLDTLRADIQTISCALPFKTTAPMYTYIDQLRINKRFTINNEEWLIAEMGTRVSTLNNGTYVYDTHIQHITNYSVRRVLLSIKKSTYDDVQRTLRDKFDFTIQNGFQVGYIDVPVDKKTDKHMSVQEYANDYKHQESEIKDDEWETAWSTRRFTF